MLGFTAVAKSLADTVIVPAGYTASVLYALGDPLTAGTPAYKNDGTDTDFENRAGDHHDGMEWFGLGADRQARRPAPPSAACWPSTTKPPPTRSSSSFFLHADGGTTTLPRPAAEVDKEVALHGIVRGRSDARPAAVGLRCKDSALQPPPDAADATSRSSGPARGNALMVTKYSTNGTATRGTLNNCGTGKTPWGTFLTGEENWSGYFTRGATDDAARGNDKSVAVAQPLRPRPGRRLAPRLGNRRQRTTSTRAGTSARPAPRPTAATTTATR